jgi:hypothetical protein
MSARFMQCQAVGKSMDITDLSSLRSWQRSSWGGERGTATGTGCDGETLCRSRETECRGQTVVKRWV